MTDESHKLRSTARRQARANLSSPLLRLPRRIVASISAGDVGTGKGKTDRHGTPISANCKNSRHPGLLRALLIALRLSLTPPICRLIRYDDPVTDVIVFSASSATNERSHTGLSDCRNKQYVWCEELKMTLCAWLWGNGELHSRKTP